jgi:hypothetical protein
LYLPEHARTTHGVAAAVDAALVHEVRDHFHGEVVLAASREGQYGQNDADFFHARTFVLAEV